MSRNKESLEEIKNPNLRRRFNFWKPGKASDYIQLLSSIKPGDYVIPCCRVSTFEQNRSKKLSRQLDWLRKEMLRLGAVIVDEVLHEGSGTDPIWLREAALIAKKKHAKLVATETDRFIRHRDFHSKTNPNLQASDSDLKNLQFHTLGVPLVTVLHPDATPEETRSFQRKRGQEMSGCKGGGDRLSGYKKRRKEKMLAEVLARHLKGVSLSQILKRTGIPKSTIRDWINENENQN